MYNYMAELDILLDIEVDQSGNFKQVFVPIMGPVQNIID
jgi:hypothetical protein